MSALTDALVEPIALQLEQHGQTLAVAESCTGGMIAAALTDRAGSSMWFDRGYVTYSNAAKQDLLGVPEAVIAIHGAVSQATALAMAGGVLVRAPVHWAIAVTGIAGPGGGSEDKPVGTVWIAWAERGGRTVAQQFAFDGDRAAIRAQSVAAALGGLLQRLNGDGESS
ncbi:CinA family protein [Sinimarinibacterium sp. CAU 1509]|uniref:CinA family protein n=1 Tax=Sinimarinibacterium sp. CAU 1509 TaxID=2562283 RepID=UPI0010AC7FCA|nr:CinA family protein [Sinimarinibacterium sp. CAU 1509]TJY56637.1 CinA family protein [Sinimarinibacterium sp. CAU 1509]